MPEENNAPAVIETPAAAPEQAQPEQKKPDFAFAEGRDNYIPKERLDREIAKVRAEAEEKSRLMVENARLSERLKLLEKPADETPRTEEQPPDSSQFKEFEDYNKALINYEVKKRLTEERTKIEREGEEQKKLRQTEEQTRSFAENLNAKIAEGEAKYPGFGTEIRRTDRPYTAEMLTAMLATGAFEDVAVTLHNNPAEFMRLRNLSGNPVALGVEMGRIGAVATAKPVVPPQVSNTPPPSAPLPADGASKSGELTTADWIKMRNEQEKKKG
jgi:hypothetical protein